jgi:hypothetical protein
MGSTCSECECERKEWVLNGPNGNTQSHFRIFAAMIRWIVARAVHHELFGENTVEKRWIQSESAELEDGGRCQ